MHLIQYDKAFPKPHLNETHSQCCSQHLFDILIVQKWWNKDIVTLNHF